MQFDIDDIEAFAEHLYQFSIDNSLDLVIFNHCFPANSNENLYKLRTHLMVNNTSDNQIVRVHNDYKANLRLLDPTYASLDGEHPEDVVSQEHYDFVFCHLYAVALWSETTRMCVDIPGVALDGHGDLGLSWDSDNNTYGGACSIGTDKKMAWFQGDHSLARPQYVLYRSKGIVPQPLIASQIAMLCIARETLAKPQYESTDHQKNHEAVS